jgi:hypothetical protein
VDKWRRWADERIKPEVLTMNLHRYAFKEVTAIVNANGQLPGSYFLEFTQDTYATSQAIAVRRQAEVSSRVVSLGQLIAEIESDAGRLTRSYWVGLWSDPTLGGRADAAFTRHFAPGGGNELDPAVPARDLQRLAAGARSVSAYVDEYVAHSDATQRTNLPTFDDLDTAIDTIGELFIAYYNLLTASTWHTLVPAIQHNWLAIFRQPWMP